MASKSQSQLVSVESTVVITVIVDGCSRKYTLKKEDVPSYITESIVNYDTGAGIDLKKLIDTLSVSQQQDVWYMLSGDDFFKRIKRVRGREW